MKTIPRIITLVLALLPTTLFAGYADDRAEIQNISNKYMVAVDAGDIATVMETWAQDGRLEWIGGIEEGKDEIFAAMSNFGGSRYVEIPEGAKKRKRTRHQIINHVIDVEGNHATSTAYWFAMTNNNPHGEVRILYMGHYADELEKVNGKWLFKVRKVYNESFDNSALWYPELGEIDPRTRKPK
jgi:hypothetical protein